jgi:ADP-dependent NAD(P)H-hydrate dehydratase / NAD(P)H-hydrate epimerase
MKIVSAAEMREIDRVTTEKFGWPSLSLMENAGEQVAAFVINRYPEARRIAVVCGKGNNGGDGFVAARKLSEWGKEVKVLLLADSAELKGDAAEMFAKIGLPVAIARGAAEAVVHLGEMRVDCDLAIDAVLGSGFRPPISDLYKTACSIIGAFKLVVAVDLPSGADADRFGPQAGEIVRADSIVTFTAPRPAHVFSELTKGPIAIGHIGSPQKAVRSTLHLRVTTPDDVERLVRDRKRESNKGTYGHVLIIGGSTGKAGAAAMAGIAALRSGAGLSTVATAKSAVSTVAGFYPEIMTEPLPETEGGTIATGAGVRIEELFKTMTVVAIGPGISRDPHTATLVRSLVASHAVPMVIDADGLNAFEHQPNELNGKGRILVITPHPGEMARLTGLTVPEVQNDRIAVARRFAAEHQLVVVLKGHRTLIAEPDGKVWVNTTGNPGMATGGTGDILTGMTAGLMAQYPVNRFRAVLGAVYLHGLAGDIIRERHGELPLIATDLLEGLPEAIRRVRNHSPGDPVTWLG